ncbi:hypothetical protein [Dactylosporangium sp. CA-233914]|uniref:hypothetical protein n=1 Tax=Dactylosporangium sp. CA-233914 TaxID=3239934 RepID=UPI003D906C53
MVTIALSNVEADDLDAGCRNDGRRMQGAVANLERPPTLILLNTPGPTAGRWPGIRDSTTDTGSRRRWIAGRAPVGGHR